MGLELRVQDQLRGKIQERSKYVLTKFAELNVLIVSVRIGLVRLGDK